VDPGLYAAAAKVDDGELVPEPVPEGENHAVIWRRGTRPARDVGLEQATPAIREALARQRTTRAITELLARLRKRSLEGYHPELIAEVPLEQPEDLRPSARWKDAIEPTEAPAPPSATAGRLSPPTPSASRLR
jgi:hypothetical protein